MILDALRRKRCETMLRKGYARVREFDAALEIANELEAQHYSGASGGDRIDRETSARDVRHPAGKLAGLGVGHLAEAGRDLVDCRRKGS